ncbi:hypothetical protein [Aestuariivita sp.]|jgi:hypothetical protein|uniref:hypothetical protein n=1 Tax=Aestuariivita sp. TaxID=1872407 RepID=UPI00216C33E7|nr:hypothetical protein [Aestuariivita sp.]MCE8008129.1 hypothetical protein [Aestuariivita sp.]
MSIADELDMLRATVPGCTLVAFGDLNARIVLCASAAQKPPQEDLDALCLSASGALDGGFAGSVAAFLGGSRLTQAVTLGSGEIRLFLRSHLDSADALFCTFTDQTDIRDMLDAGRRTLHRISEQP